MIQGQKAMGDARQVTNGKLPRRALLIQTATLLISIPALTALTACGGSSEAAHAPTMTMPAMAMPVMATPTTISAATPRAAGNTVTDAPSGPKVGIDNFNFSPKSLSVSVGTTVTWTNHDDVPHTVTSRDKTFSSQAIDTDGTFSFIFAKPGTYAYFCAIHPIMTAEIVVK